MNTSNVTTTNHGSIQMMYSPTNIHSHTQIPYASHISQLCFGVTERISEIIRSLQGRE
jgi:hypothetical protein